MTGGSTLVKYVALQVPGLLLFACALAVLVLLFDLSLPVVAGLLALWVVKDALMYPIVRVAYEDADPDATLLMVGRLGRAQVRIDPEGWVQLGSELWRAELAPGALPVEGGGAVRVVSVRGLVLDVEPE